MDGAAKDSTLEVRVRNLPTRSLRRINRVTRTTAVVHKAAMSRLHSTKNHSVADTRMTRMLLLVQVDVSGVVEVIVVGKTLVKVAANLPGIDWEERGTGRRDRLFCFEVVQDTGSE